MASIRVSKVGIILSFLVLILLFDLVLLLLIVENKQTKSFLEKVNIVDKQFKTSNDIYTFSAGEIKMFPGNTSNLISTTLVFLSKVNQSPEFNEESDFYYLPVTIKNESSQSIKTTVLLGKKTDSLPALIARRGEIPTSYTVKLYKIEEILPLLKPNYPLIISLYYDNQISEAAKKSSLCNSDCLEFLAQKTNYYDEADSFYSLLNNSENNKNIKIVGLAESLVIYVD